MKFWVNKDGQAVNAGTDHATAAMTRIMPRAVVERISNETSSDGLAVAVRNWMHERGWMRVEINDDIMSVVQPYAATQYHLTTAQRQWIEDKKAENNSIKVEFNTRDTMDAKVVPSSTVQKMVSKGTSHWD